MRLTRNKISYLILFGYFIILCCTSYILLRNKFIREKIDEEKFRQISELADDDIDWNPWGEEFENENDQNIISHHEPPKILWNLEEKKKEAKTVLTPWNSSMGVVNVEVWGKASIGLYLWEHILQGGVEERMGGVWSYGAKTINNIKFTFRTGPGVLPDKVPKDTKNLLLILNGKVPFCKLWLDSLASLTELQSVGVVMLGSEKCNNSWIFPYLYKNGGPIKFLFTTYDSPDIDDITFYQWPLGVATYRGFPAVDSSSLPVHKFRKYSCNFIGTVYPNSTRVKLKEILLQDPAAENCYTFARNSWMPLETDESRETYIQTLSQSDLTLNPVGQNTECYRIYEAISYGSVPVVEDVMTSGDCGKSPSSDLYPLRLLKEYKAPIIYIKNWSELTTILEKEKSLRHSDKVKRRRELLLWYESFKSKMREKLVKTIYRHFFNIQRR